MDFVLVVEGGGWRLLGMRMRTIAMFKSRPCIPHRIKSSELHRTTLSKVTPTLYRTRRRRRLFDIPNPGSINTFKMYMPFDDLIAVIIWAREKKLSMSMYGKVWIPFPVSAGPAAAR